MNGYKLKIRVKKSWNVDEIRQIARLTGCRRMSVTENVMGSSYDIELTGDSEYKMGTTRKYIKMYLKSEGIETE